MNHKLFLFVILLLGINILSIYAQDKERDLKIAKGYESRASYHDELSRRYKYHADRYSKQAEGYLEEAATCTANGDTVKARICREWAKEAVNKADTRRLWADAAASVAVSWRQQAAETRKNAGKDTGGCHCGKRQRGKR